MRALLLALAAALLSVGQLPSTEAKGYYNVGYGRTYYYGPTRYYFFYGGTRHYYGTRTWNQCNGHCDQSVYLDQASWTINAVDGTPPQFSGYETPNQIKRAISAQWIGVNQNLIQVTCASATCSVQVMLPDGSSKYQFQSTIQNGCLGGGTAYTSQGVNTGGTVSCSAVSLTRVAVQPESGASAVLPSMLALGTAALAALY